MSQTCGILYEGTRGLKNGDVNNELCSYAPTVGYGRMQEGGASDITHGNTKCTFQPNGSHAAVVVSTDN